jgi:arginyl-tRNA synthetase
MQEGPSKIVKQEFISLLQSAVKKAYPDSKIDSAQIELSLSVPNSSLGDMSSSIAFKLAKMMGKNPIEIAKRLAAGMKSTDLISVFKDANGYVNAFLD